ncbi:hypothetical protein [Hymenobacter sp. PAMC 26628]|uniref:hypothetical protein n=1 Tax=Hymenobacter sp. PAMC 26628 TaxID=1484118 RepID=UPI00076FE70F|nr:hypothetical protein [Hymenobacter sp. PAMC 26628]AMJ67659.1 hypothetical protein AXW84_21250 [Hymenobacter sp. PAMC 26628]
MSDSPTLLLRVAAAWAVPGLGLLALPAGPDGALRAHALHTALPIEARLPGGPTAGGTATVEEIEREGVASYGLLLDLGALVTVPPGTEIWQMPDPPL